MHEMSLCESIIQLIEDQALAQQFNRVTKVFIEVGAFAGVEVDAMHFCFDVVSRNTLAEDASLIITELAAQAWCFDCSTQVSVTSRLDLCPLCSGVSLKCESGDEMRIKELEVH
ncbi:hydrogenase maturation nickel metallochaperone HypA [Vibrio sp. RC27]